MEGWSWDRRHHRVSGHKQQLRGLPPRVCWLLPRYERVIHLIHSGMARDSNLGISPVMTQVWRELTARIGQALQDLEARAPPNVEQPEGVKRHGGTPHALAVGGPAAGEGAVPV